MITIVLVVLGVLLAFIALAVSVRFMSERYASAGGDTPAPNTSNRRGRFKRLVTSWKFLLPLGIGSVILIGWRFGITNISTPSVSTTGGFDIRTVPLLEGLLSWLHPPVEGIFWDQFPDVHIVKKWFFMACILYAVGYVFTDVIKFPKLGVLAITIACVFCVMAFTSTDLFRYNPYAEGPYEIDQWFKIYQSGAMLPSFIIAGGINGYLLKRWFAGLGGEQEAISNIWIIIKVGVSIVLIHIFVTHFFYEKWKHGDTPLKELKIEVSEKLASDPTEIAGGQEFGRNIGPLVVHTFHDQAGNPMVEGETIVFSKDLYTAIKDGSLVIKMGVLKNDGTCEVTLVNKTANQVAVMGKVFDEAVDGPNHLIYQCKQR